MAKIIFRTVETPLAEDATIYRCLAWDVSDILDDDWDPGKNIQDPRTGAMKPGWAMIQVGTGGAVPASALAEFREHKKDVDDNDIARHRAKIDRTLLPAAKRTSLEEGDRVATDVTLGEIIAARIIV